MQILEARWCIPDATENTYTITNGPTNEQVAEVGDFGQIEGSLSGLRSLRTLPKSESPKRFRKRPIRLIDSSRIQLSGAPLRNSYFIIAIHLWLCWIRVDAAAVIDALALES